MSLYDDLEVTPGPATLPLPLPLGAVGSATGTGTTAGSGTTSTKAPIKSAVVEKEWSSAIKLLHSQLQVKKVKALTTTPSNRKTEQTLAPVVDLKSKRDDDDNVFPIQMPILGQSSRSAGNILPFIPLKNYDWGIIGEYDPVWPNDYDKVVREIREQRDREFDRKDDKDKKKKPIIEYPDPDELAEKLLKPPDDQERFQQPRMGPGAAIAPPPSLQDSAPSSPGRSSPTPTPSPVVEKPSFSTGNYGGGSVAAKIMAKYGFREGQGLGKKEQGMSIALQVEKTSKRGGRIIHEKDTAVMPPPPIFAPPINPGSPSVSADVPFQPKPEPSITEIMKNPSKVVLLRNMVGPGDVDEELEPEVKDECNTKYGEVIKVIIYEIPTPIAEEAVRIFVEFKRIESAVKAVVDLNGRFFGGRQVRAGFYSVEKFNNLQLLD